MGQPNLPILLILSSRKSFKQWDTLEGVLVVSKPCCLPRAFRGGWFSEIRSHHLHTRSAHVEPQMFGVRSPSMRSFKVLNRASRRVSTEGFLPGILGCQLASPEMSDGKWFSDLSFQLPPPPPPPPPNPLLFGDLGCWTCFCLTVLCVFFFLVHLLLFKCLFPLKFAGY